MPKPVRPEPSAEPGADVRFPPPLVYLIAILCGVALWYLLMPLRAPVTRPVGVVSGLLLVALAVTLATSARRLMVSTGQSPIPWKPSPELILRGPYKFSRNPMYLGLTVLEIGVGLAFDNLWISLLAFPALAAVHFIAVLPEERYLSAKFGEPYRAYLARVRRYI